MKKERIAEIWKDPVWSKVIAAAILGAIGSIPFLYSFLIYFSYNEFINGIIDSLTKKRYLTIPFTWGVSIIVFFYFVLFVIVLWWWHTKFVIRGLFSAIGTVIVKIFENLGKKSKENQSHQLSGPVTLAEIISPMQEKKKDETPVDSVTKDGWRRDYGIFKNSDIFQFFPDIISRIDKLEFTDVDKDVVSYFLTQEIIGRPQFRMSKENKYTFTKKGTFFFKLYLEDKYHEPEKVKVILSYNGDGVIYGDNSDKKHEKNYLIFKSSKVYEFFSDIISGVEAKDNFDFYKDHDVVSYYETQEIIIWDKNSFYFSPKGRYFVKRYFEDKFHKTSQEVNS